MLQHEGSRRMADLPLPAGFLHAQAATILPAVDVAQQVAAILSSELEIVPAKFESPSRASAGALSERKRLPPIREFVAAGGDWIAFQRCFKAACPLVGWFDMKALQALPTEQDDDYLAEFEAIPEADRATLPRACAQMAAIFDPPSNACQRFVLQRRGEAKTPVTFCSALLALGHAAYPHMEQTALDFLALERLLSLAGGG
ncbi:unnamed protein product [Lampetra fluviatilis]